MLYKLINFIQIELDNKKCKNEVDFMTLIQEV